MRSLFNLLLLVIFCLSISTLQASDLFNKSHVRDAFKGVGSTNNLLSQKCAVLNAIQTPEAPKALSGVLGNSKSSFLSKELSFDLALDAAAYQGLSFLEGLSLDGKIAKLRYSQGKVFIDDIELNKVQIDTVSNYLKKLCQD